MLINSDFIQLFMTIHLGRVSYVCFRIARRYKTISSQSWCKFLPLLNFRCLFIGLCKLWCIWRARCIYIHSAGRHFPRSNRIDDEQHIDTWKDNLLSGFHVNRKDYIANSLTNVTKGRCHFWKLYLDFRLDIFSRNPELLAASQWFVCM